MAKSAEGHFHPDGASRLRSRRLEPAKDHLLAGPPLTTREMARMVGMSATFIREEIHGGYLRAVVVGRGRKRVYRIPVLEAYRYIKELGIL